MEIIDEIGGIPYWVWKFKMDLKFIHKKMPSKKPQLCIAKVFLL